MALDAANFIAELSITDPPGTDPLSQGDDQIRTAKRAVFNSFEFIDKAVVITADQMNLMAIKNEANVFTADQTLQDSELILDDVSDVGNQIQFQRGGLLRWTVTVSPDSTNNEWVLARFDVAGDFVDRPMEADRLTGVVNFAHVPTVQGDPLWIVGEVKMIVQGASLPSNNWFLCNGTSGTVDLRDRILAAQGTFVGTRTPFLDAQTTVGPVTGSHVLTEAQMPDHGHLLLSGVNGTGITDTTLAFSSTVQNDTVIGGNRENQNAIYIDDNNNNKLFVAHTGDDAGHTHTIPELEVETAGTDAFQVMPFSYFMQAIQYVP